MVVVFNCNFSGLGRTWAKHAADTQSKRASWLSPLDCGDARLYECAAYHADDFGGGRGLGADEIASVV